MNGVTNLSAKSVEVASGQLALDDWHRQAGGRMVDFAGYKMPVQYEGIMAEHLWTRDHAGLFDVSHMGQLLIRGPKVEAALEAVLPTDLTGSGAGRVRYSYLLTDDGGIIDDLMITLRGDGFYMVVNGATKFDDLAYLRRVLPASIEIEHLADHGLLALQGPSAVDVLARLVADVDELAFMAAAAFSIDGIEVWISRSGYTGEDGFEISVPNHAIVSVASLLAEQPEVKPIGLGARDSLRLEAGLPLYGHDIDTDTDPVSAGLGFAILKQRRLGGGFPGDARIIRMLQAGSVNERVGIIVEGRQPVREGAEIVDENGQTIGRVTSGGFSPSLGRPIAMAYVPKTLASPGTNLTLTQRGKPFAGCVTPLPFVPHRYHRKDKAR